MLIQFNEQGFWKQQHERHTSLPLPARIQAKYHTVRHARELQFAHPPSTNCFVDIKAPT